MLAPPRPPVPEELEALIREARARQRKRWVAAAALVAVLAGAALGIRSIAAGTHRASVSPGGKRRAAVKARGKCGVRVVGTRILAGDGSVVYRDPSQVAAWDQLQCSGSTVWVVFGNGAGMMHEEYVGVRSPDRGRTWRVAFAQNPGVRARYGIGAEVGPWALAGRRTAYFVGFCPACSLGSAFGTVALTVTEDGGRTFRTYPVPALAGFEPVHLRVAGDVVAISARRVARKVDKPPYEIYRHKTVKVRVA